MKKKIFTIVLSLAMIITTFTTAVFASDITDIPNNWSKTALENAVSNGLLKGNKGKLMPKENLTRAQMAAIVNRAFGTIEKADLGQYTDITENSWYYDDMSKAVEMQTFVGNDNYLNPNNNITREEAFVVLARAFKLSNGTTSVLNKFTDCDLVSSWAKESAASLVGAGYIAGSNDKLNPKENITRAEFAQIMDNLLKNYITKAGTYTKDMSGNVMINVSDVILKDMTVSGDLIVGDGVGNGDITLNSVNVTGRTVIRGGGVHSIKIIGNSNIQDVVIARVDGQTRVYCDNEVEIGDVLVDGSDNVILEGDVNNVAITAPDITVTATKANFVSATIKGKNSIMIVSDDSEIETAIVEAENAQIKVETGSKIQDVVASGDGVKISGFGTIGTVEAKGDDITVTAQGTSVTAASGTTNIMAGTKTVVAGSTQIVGTTYRSRSSGHGNHVTTKDTTAPSGYQATIDKSAINNDNQSDLSFTFESAEVGAAYYYSIDDTNDETSAITGTGIIVTETDQINNVDVSGLDDDILTLTVYLIDAAGNQGSNTIDTITKDTTAPSGYQATINESAINNKNQSDLGFTFESAEVGTAYYYSIDDINDSTLVVTGSGIIATSTDQITGIDVSSLDDDILTLMVYLTDSYGNQGSDTTDTVVKNTTAPSGYSISFDQSAVNITNDTAVSFTFSSAEVGTDYTYSINDTNAGTAAITGSGIIATSTDQITGIDVSSLDDDTLTLTVYLTDSYGNQGSNATDTVVKDATAPSGYSISFDQSTVNTTNDTAVSFTFTGAEVGATYYYAIDDTNAGTAAITGSGNIVTATNKISGLDVSGLDDDTLTLTIYLTDNYGSQGNDVTDTIVKDTEAPSSYSVNIDQSAVNSTNDTSVSFTFASAEVGATYNYSVDDNNGGTAAVTGSGDIATATDQISGLDVSGLADDTLTLTVYLTDDNGNQGSNAIDTVTKETIVPSGYSIHIDQGTITSANDTAMSFTFASAEVGTDYAYSISDGSNQVTGSGSIATATDQITGIDISGLDDGNLNLSVTLTDAAGNVGTAATDSITKEATAPSGYSISFDQSAVNITNGTAVSFTFSGAEVGATYYYAIDDTNEGTAAITGSGTIETATDQITGIDVSSLDDDTLTLTLYLTDSYGNQGSNTTDTVVKNCVPTRYTVSVNGNPSRGENGTYKKDGTQDSKPYYVIDSYCIIWNTISNRWEIDNELAFMVWYNNDTGDIPPCTGWIDGSGNGYTLTVTRN
ncbi:S-layer homology domain-containing protein [Anaerovorax odorimutans]|uniref:S-layer homology domain-containing protein n=1 Tax=Anaerovorax odorimutans TaxID=109327 RepID=UPI00040E0B23|nr:S-layer homology domain-containing protein [Anaerovorax odorimutans]